MRSFIISISLVAVLGVLAVFGLPQIRSTAWKETLVSKQAESKNLPSEWDEDSIVETMAVDGSRYDWKSDIRLIRSVPNTPVALEAAFRQRRTDICESLAEGEPLEITQHAVLLTARDRHRAKEVRMPSTRREIATIGLNMLPTDQRQLPVLSRPLILDFLNNHFLSLQARIFKDAGTSNWILHYRPIAAVGKYTGIPFSQKWVEAISNTVQDIRGLGIAEAKGDQDGSQTAVILFRLTWLDERGETSGIRHELGFIHARPSTNRRNNDPFEIHFVATSNHRSVWNYFPPNANKRTRSENDCSLVGTIRFDEFMRGGLQPKSTVTRRMLAHAGASFRVEQIDNHLEGLGLQGGWSEHLSAAIAGIIGEKIPQQTEKTEYMPARRGF